MTVANRIAVAHALLDRFRAVFAAFQNGRRMGIAMTLSIGVPLPKSETLPDAGDEPKSAQPHRRV